MQNVAPADSDSNAEVFDIRTVISMLRIHKWLFAGVFVAVFLAGVALSLSAPSKYTSSASGMIGGQKLKVVPKAQEVAADLPQDSTAIDTEVEVLRSLALADSVVTQLGLEKDAEFNPTLAKPSGLAAYLPKKASGNVDPQTLRQMIIANVLQSVAVKRQGLTRVITVSVETGSPVKSAQIASAWVNQYTKRQVNQSSSLLANANEQLGERLEELRTQAIAADAAVQQFKIANGLGVDNPLGGTSLPEQQMLYLQQQQGEAKASLAANQARLDAARNVARTGDASTGDTLNSEVLRDLRTRETEVRTRLANLRSRYGAMHPEVVKATNEEAAVERQVQAEMNRIVANLQTQVDVDKQRLAALQGGLSSARGSLNKDLAANTRLHDLQMQAEAAHTVYESYLQRHKDTTTQQGLESSTARVLSEAKVPTVRSSPKLGFSVMLSFVAGLIAGAAAVGVKYAMRRGISSGTDVVKHLNVPYLGGIANLASTVKTRISTQGKLWEYLEANPLSVFAEQYKILLTAINFSKVSEDKRVIAITSAIPGEGKTTTSICLGKTIQMLGKSVVVVDCDLRRHSVSSSIGGDYKAGLIEVLQNKVSLDSALYDGGRGVVYLPVTDGPVPSENQFGTPRMAALLEELKTRFDVIILDTAPVLPIVDTRLLAHQADVVVLLAKWNDTPVGATQTALDILYNEGLDNLAGVALTLVDLKKQSIASGIGSEYYYNSYKSYYTTSK